MDSRPAQRTTTSPNPSPAPLAEIRTTRRRSWLGRHGVAGILIALAVVAIGGYLGFAQYRVSRLADAVRRSFAARRYDEARGPLQLWLAGRPPSGEAQYYRAWLALADERPSEAVEAAERAQRLGFDRAPLEVL